MLDDHQLAANLAARAGALLLGVRAEGLGERTGDEGDRRANTFLLDGLHEARPGDAVLSEEAADDLIRLAAERVWIVDPLDGTREFGESGRTDWAVHVALWRAGHGLIAGAVALPALGFTLATGAVHTAGGGPGSLARTHQVVVSRTRPPESAAMVAHALDSELLPMGSAGAKVCAVIRGEADAYVHAGGLWEWDAAAPVAVAVAVGLHVSHVDGSALVFNKERPWTGDLLVCRPELADAALAALR